MQYLQSKQWTGNSLIEMEVFLTGSFVSHIVSLGIFLRLVVANLIQLLLIQLSSPQIYLGSHQLYKSLEQVVGFSVLIKVNIITEKS